MKIHSNIKTFSVRNPVVTVGIFDGVHKGHKYIIDRVKVAAREKNGESVIVTLWPHPRLVLNHDPDGFKLLNSLEEKQELLEDAGIDNLVIVEFTKEFSRLSPCDFIKNILIEQVRLKHLVIGYNHRFGHNREGDYSSLKECADKYMFTIEQIPDFFMGEKKISSSVIRDALLEGKVIQANQMLGRDYSIEGSIIGGTRVGRTIGFPTANIEVKDQYKLIPKDGVYAVEAKVGTTWYKGMLNIGIRPTINTRPDHKTVEVHIIDFDKNIYKKNIQLNFVERIRDEMKFDTIGMLKDQLIKDKERTLEIFNNSKDRYD